jgi:hypothetical protein
MANYVDRSPEAIFLIVCDPSMNKLWTTYAGLCIDLYGSRSLTTGSSKGSSWLKIQPLLLISNNWKGEWSTLSLPIAKMEIDPKKMKNHFKFEDLIVG